MTLNPSKQLLFSCLFLFYARVLSQYGMTTDYYYDTYTTTSSSYTYQTTTTLSYYYSTTTSLTSYYDSSSHTYIYSTPSTTYSTEPSVTSPSGDDPPTATVVTDATPIAADPNVAKTPWYQTTAGKWGLGAGGTSCCMCIFGFVTWCVKKRHRKAAKGIYSKLNGKHGKKGHDPSTCTECSAGYAGGVHGQAQPFLYNPQGYMPKQMNVAWQPQSQNGAWHGNA